MGVLWDTYRKHYGPDGVPSVLVAKGTTRDFNATIPQSEIDRELERDPARNSAELLAEFRSDLEGYVSYEVVQSCIGSYFEQAPAQSVSYYGFTDPSGGSDDSFSLSISHRSHDRVVIDCIREVKPPFSPEQVIIDFVSVLKSYRCHRVSGDRFGGEFPREQFNKRGVRYEPSERNKSEIYRDFLPLLNSGNVVLPRNDRLIRQLTSLERTTARGSGRDNIDHPSGQHDDVANAVAGAAVIAAAGAGYNLSLLAGAFSDSDDDESDAAPSYFQLQAERRHCALMERYGQPVSLAPQEYREAERKDLPEGVTEAFERARADALRRNGGGP
jgi:hypothetical protein